MSVTPTCVHCLGLLREPGLWSSSWQCSLHGDSLPFYDAPTPGPHVLDQLCSTARVPVWLPDPLPPGWCVSGIGWVGDERAGSCATVIACCGPAPLGGPAEVAFIAEEPGVGLAARLARLPGGGLRVGEGPGGAKVTAAQHPTPLWELPGGNAERVGYAGEARGVWLAGVFWPAAASLLLIEHVILVDLRDLPTGPHGYPGLVFGAPSRRLSKGDAAGRSGSVQTVSRTAPAGEA